MKNRAELLRILKSLKHDIYLDYPQGRSKPPRPKLSLDEAIKIAHDFPTVKYFAVSNVEDPKKIKAIKDKLPTRIEVVPKIETEKGVHHMREIIDAIKTKNVMLDKEDLYVDVRRNSDKFDALVAEARSHAKKAKINLLELHGVVFMPYKSGRRV